MMLVAFITLTSANYFIAKTYAAAAEEPIKAAAIYAKNHDLSVKMEGINVPSFNFYQEKINNQNAKIILTKKSNFKRYPKARILFEKNAILLIDTK